MAQGYSQQKIKKISLTNGFSNAINLPRHIDKEGDFPLYPHGEGSKIAMQRSEGWYRAGHRNFNSPSNVRVVCLSRDGANVLYWAPPFKGGSLSMQVEAASPYIFDKTAKVGIEQQINRQKYTWDNAGLQALISPVVLSNIEELWLSADIFNCTRYQAYYNQLSVLQPGQVLGAKFLSMVLEAEISTGSKPRTIADTFPLLRAIVVVTTQPNSPVQDFHKCAIRTAEVKKYLETTYPDKRRTIGENPELMERIAQATGFGFTVQPITTGDVLKFSLGDYKYDQRVLSGFREKLLTKYSTVVAKESRPVIPQPTEEPQAVELQTAVPEPAEETTESLTDVIKLLEAEYPDKKVVAKALFAYKVANPQYFKQQISGLPDELKRTYSTVFNDIK